MHILTERRPTILSIPSLVIKLSTLITLYSRYAMWPVVSGLGLMGFVQVGKRLFKVPRRKFQDDSEIFRDMFSSSHPDVTSMIDECPVVHLPDSGSDMHHVLQALYDRR